MPVKFTCTSCQSAMQVMEQFAGKKVRCPKCQAVVIAPGPAAQAPLPVAVPVAVPVAPQPARAPSMPAAAEAIPMAPDPVPLTPIPIDPGAVTATPMDVRLGVPLPDDVPPEPDLSEMPRRRRNRDRPADEERYEGPVAQPSLRPVILALVGTAVLIVVSLTASYFWGISLAAENR